MIQLTDKLLAILAPSVHKNRYFKLWNSIYNEWVIECQIDNVTNNYINKLGDITDYFITGVISSSSDFDFDCEKYVEQQWGDKYKDYTKVGCQNNPFIFKTKEESFISFLESKKIFLNELKDQKILILEKL